MKPLSLFVAGLVVSLSSCGGGGSAASIPQADACRQASHAICTKVYSCQGDQTLALVQGLLISEPACEATIQLTYCAPFQCTAAQSYHGDKAQMCKDQFGTTSCATLSAAAASLNAANLTSAATFLAGSVPVCQQICTAGDGGPSTGG